MTSQRMIRHAAMALRRDVRRLVPQQVPAVFEAHAGRSETAAEGMAQISNRMVRKPLLRGEGFPLR